MKLTIKSLKQIPYDVEVANDQATVEELKKTIENVHNFDSTSLKLVFNGVVLDNAKKLSEIGIKESSVIVMMTSKAKPVNVPKEEAKTEEKVQNTGTTGTNVSNTSTSGTGNANTGSTTTTQQRPQADYSTQVKDLMDMGFPKTESEAAIKAARGDVNVAIEFLYNGIPENLPQESSSGSGSGSGSGSAGGVIKNIASIVKILCQNDPSQLQNILLSLQQSSPELIQLIRENEEEFKNLLQQPITEEDMAAFTQFNNQAGLGGQSGQGQTRQTGQSGSGQSGSRQGREVIKLSQEDYTAVNTLKEYGFSEMDAVQAYFACDKNIEHAANLLFENKLRESEHNIEFDCKFLLNYFRFSSVRTSFQSSKYNPNQRREWRKSIKC